MAASTVPAAKLAILALLTARPNLNEVAITWGEPTETEDLRDEMMFFEDPVTRRPDWGPLGGGLIDEEYVLTFKVKNRIVGDDQAGAEQRAWALVYEIEQSLRGTRLGGTLLKPIDLGEQEYRTTPLSDGWYGEISIPLVCTARI